MHIPATHCFVHTVNHLGRSTRAGLLGAIEAMHTEQNFHNWYFSQKNKLKRTERRIRIFDCRVQEKTPGTGVEPVAFGLL